MIISFTRSFQKQYKKADKTIQKTFQKRLKLFMEDPLNDLLRNHALQGKLSGYRSINITGDWRALYSVNQKDNELVIFEAIGTHSQLYK